MFDFAFSLTKSGPDYFFLCTVNVNSYWTHGCLLMFPVECKMYYFPSKYFCTCRFLTKLTNCMKG